MEESNGDGSPGASTAEPSSEEGTFRRVVARYNRFQESVSTVTPRVVKVVELVLAIVLLVGTVYWAYAYLVVGA